MTRQDDASVGDDQTSHCSRSWLDRWLNRYDPDWVENSLSDRKVGPKQVCNPWSDEVRQQVLEMRRLRTQLHLRPLELVVT